MREPRPLIAALMAAACGEPVTSGGPLPAAQQSEGPPRLVRGPYLQSSSATGVVLRWRTSAPAASVVSYGAAPDRLTSTAGSDTPATDHAVTLAGLQPATRYHYAVGTRDARLAGGDAETAFVTAPAPGTARPTRIWAYGDGGWTNSILRGVRDSIARATAGRPIDLVLWLGDMAYFDTTDSDLQTVFDFHKDLLKRTPLWTALGNHETHVPGAVPYLDAVDLPTKGEAGGLASGSERYYSFDHGDVHFVCLDSMSSDRGPDGAMMTWLKADLAATTRRWLVAYWHHPPYTKANWDSDIHLELVEMRANVVPVLEAHGVDLVLGGHSHVYERTFLIDGHHGPSSTLTPAMKKDPGTGRPNESGPYVKPAMGRARNQGAVYVVAGSASIKQPTYVALSHAATVVAYNRNGSLLVDIDGARLEGRFVRDTGAVEDTFVIEKGGAPRPANQPPIVSVTTEARPLAPPATVNLEATASDPDGRVTKVELLYQGETLATRTAPPFTFTWQAVPPGNHVITARATDDRFGVTISPPIVVSVVTTNMPPTLALRTDRPSYVAPARVVVTAEAADVDGRIVSVEFSDAGRVLEKLTAPPFELVMVGVPVSNTAIWVKATDDTGHVAINAIRVQVFPPPPAAPAPGAPDAGTPAAGADAGARRPDAAASRAADGGTSAADPPACGCRVGAAPAATAPVPLAAIPPLVLLAGALRAIGRRRLRGRRPRRR